VTGDETTPGYPQDAHDFGPAFEQQLIDACAGRLREIHWFRTVWQRGGAATGYAQVQTDDDRTLDAVIKFPVGPREYRLLVDLCETDAPTPRLAFHGTELGSYDFAWVVMEHLPGEPLKSTRPKPNKKLFTAVADAAARFYLHTAERWALDRRPPAWDFRDLVEKSREACKHNPIPDVQRWSNVLHDVAKHLDRLLTTWNARSMNTWCHGDLHLANIMERPKCSPWREANNGGMTRPDASTTPGADDATSRGAPDPSNVPSDVADAVAAGVSDATTPAADDAPDCVLLDFGEVHPGHWVEDAVYLERIYWANPDVAKKVKFVNLFAKARKALGLDCSDDYATLAQVRRVLMASCVPAWLHRENHPAYLNAALEMIERTLPALIK
jgi:hypothetical protein